MIVFNPFIFPLKHFNRNGSLPIATGGEWFGFADWNGGVSVNNLLKSAGFQAVIVINL